MAAGEELKSEGYVETENVALHKGIDGDGGGPHHNTKPDSEQCHKASVVAMTHNTSGE